MFSKKFLQKTESIVLIVFTLIGTSTLVRAMDEDEAPTESTRLRQTVQYVQPSWWQSVEIIPMPKNYKQQSQSYYRTDFKGEGSWEGSWDIHQHSYTLCCCWSWIKRSPDDLVAFESDKNKIMLRRDAIDIMQAENDELESKNSNIYYNNIDNYKIYNEKKCAEDKKEQETYNWQRKNISGDCYRYNGKIYFLRDLKNPKNKHLGVCKKVINELERIEKEKEEESKRKIEAEKQKKKREEDNQRAGELARLRKREAQRYQERLVARYSTRDDLDRFQGAIDNKKSGRPKLANGFYYND